MIHNNVTIKFELHFEKKKRFAKFLDKFIFYKNGSENDKLHKQRPKIYHSVNSLNKIRC